VDLGLSGKRAAVAASSTGLGFAIARALAAEGCSVAICGRDRARIEESAVSIREATRSEVLPAVVDVCVDGEVTGWIDHVAAGWGGLDLVVANAGGPPPGVFGDFGPDDWDAAYRLVLRSALEAARAARPHLPRGGALLFMTAASVRQPTATLVLSMVFRSGVSALAKALADEWASDGVRVNHLIPGRIATDRVAALDEESAQRRQLTVAEVRAERQRTIPLGRYGDPDELAAAAVFLLSDAASYITGATLAVDGGLLRPIV
jgi:3-oxoacyl-[acyl-carrier protein] reductase